MSAASDQITQYLSVGGLFNPEMMNQTQHEAVRDTLIKARDDIQTLERENAELRKDKERLDWLERRTVSRLDWVITHVEMNKLPIRDAFDLSIKEVGP